MSKNIDPPLMTETRHGDEPMAARANSSAVSVAGKANFGAGRIKLRDQSAFYETATNSCAAINQRLCGCFLPKQDVAFPP